MMQCSIPILFQDTQIWDHQQIASKNGRGTAAKAKFLCSTSSITKIPHQNWRTHSCSFRHKIAMWRWDKREKHQQYLSKAKLFSVIKKLIQIKHFIGNFDGKINREFMRTIKKIILLYHARTLRKSTSVSQNAILQCP